MPHDTLPVSLFVAAVAMEAIVPPDGPPFTSWAQLVLFVVALGAVLRWVWSFVKELREKKNGPGAGKVQLEMAELRGQLMQFTQTLEGQRRAIDAAIEERGAFREAERIARHDLANKMNAITAGLDERLRDVEQAVAWIRGARKPNQEGS